MNILSIIVLALIGEAVWQTLKMTWDKGKVSIDRIGALVLGLILAFGTGLDLMKLVGVPMAFPMLGILLTGILISRGANFLHDLIGSVNNIYQNSKAETPKEINPIAEVTEFKK